MGGSEGLRWPLQVPAPHPRLKRNHRGAAGSPGHLAPRQDKHRVSLSSSGGLTHPPGRLGFGGIESLSPAGGQGQKPGAGGLLDQGKEATQACHLCPVSCGPLPWGSTFPSQGVTHLSSVKTDWP